MIKFDQAQFNKAVLTWIIEANAVIVRDGADPRDRKRVGGACDACLAAYLEDAPATTPRDAALESLKAEVARLRVDLETSHEAQKTAADEISRLRAEVKRLQSTPQPQLEPRKVPTLDSNLSSVEICRANGWVVGDILTATDLGCTALFVRITGFGETHIFVRRLTSSHGECGNEYVLSLEHRDWYRLPQTPAAPEKPENSDTAAAPVATGDITRKPDALLVLDREGFMRDFFTDDDAARKFAIQLGGTCVPLYRDPPPPALTDAEREAIKVAADLDEQRADLYGRNSYGLRAATLRGLLDRLGGEQ